MWPELKNVRCGGRDLHELVLVPYRLVLRRVIASSSIPLHNSATCEFSLLALKSSDTRRSSASRPHEGPTSVNFTKGLTSGQTCQGLFYNWSGTFRKSWSARKSKEIGPREECSNWPLRFEPRGRKNAS